MHCPELSDSSMTARYPEIFENIAKTTSTSRISQVLRCPLSHSPPLQASATPTTGAKFAAPTVIVLLDPTSGFNSEIVEAVRGAADSLPKALDIIWVFNSTNIDAIEAVIPSIRPGEHLLMNGKSLTRDCGVTSAGDNHDRQQRHCQNVNLGLNRELRNVVLQTMALAD